MHEDKENGHCSLIIWMLWIRALHGAGVLKAGDNKTQNLTEIPGRPDFYRTMIVSQLCRLRGMQSVRSVPPVIWCVGVYHCKVDVRISVVVPVWMSSSAYAWKNMDTHWMVSSNYTWTYSSWFNMRLFETQITNCQKCCTSYVVNC